MPPAYKLTYFNGRAAAEPARFLLKYGNIEFEDIRIEKEDWPKIKDKTPFGQLPLLEHNRKQVNQSTAICRYLGKLVNLHGKDDWENLEIDATMDTFNDLLSKIRSFFLEQDPDKKKILHETTKTETIPYYFSRFETQAKKNNGYLTCGKLTWPDFSFAANARNFTQYFDISFETYPTLEALVEKIEELPAIKKWIAERPKTDI